MTRFPQNWVISLFLLFCMKLGDYCMFCTTKPELKKKTFGQIWAKSAQNGAKMEFIDMYCLFIWSRFVLQKHGKNAGSREKGQKLQKQGSWGNLVQNGSLTIDLQFGSSDFNEFFRKFS